MDPIVSIGQKAPDFTLPGLGGDTFTLGKSPGRIIVLYFWSAECGWCERVDDEMKGYLDEWKEQVSSVWIACNANESGDQIEKVALERNLTHVILDEHQEVANLYGAKTTPHFFVVNADGILAYQGAWDDITFRQRVATQAYVVKAVEALMKNMTPEICQTPPYGCTLVRKTGAIDSFT